MKQVSYGVKENLETLINTGSTPGNTWQRPKILILKPLNIAEAPKNAASALLKASLGEDKYFTLSFAYNLIMASGKKFIHRKGKKNLLFGENIIYYTVIHALYRFWEEKRGHGAWRKAFPGMRRAWLGSSCRQALGTRKKNINKRWYYKWHYYRIGRRKRIRRL